jgi:hypothetical protein
MKELKKLLDLKKIEEKIFKIKSKYNPNLVANLSKEAHDLYTLRIFVCDQLLEKLNEEDITIEKLREYIKNNIEENKDRFKEKKNLMDKELIQRSIDVWESFL